MAGIVVFLAIGTHYLLHLIYRCHMMGKGEELTSFLCVISLANGICYRFVLCLCLSNLGNVTLPGDMPKYVERMDFIIGVQARAPHNCGIITYNGTMYINMIRNIKEPELELRFFRALKRQGLNAAVESNQA